MEMLRPSPQTADSTHPEDAPHDKTDNTCDAPVVKPEVPPSNEGRGRPGQRGNHSQPDWKVFIEVVAVLTGLGLLAVNICQVRTTKRAADAARASVELARKNTHFDQRAWLNASFVPNVQLIDGQPFSQPIRLVNTEIRLRAWDVRGRRNLVPE